MSARLRVPVLPTVLVAVAVALMVWLGFWQIRRLHWKEGLLARYSAAQDMPAVAFPHDPHDQRLLFRRSTAFCPRPLDWRASEGHNRAGRSGWKHVADCRIGAGGPMIAIDVGWSNDPADPSWKGGRVTGIIGPDHDGQVLLVADAAPPGLQPSEPPSLADIPNNHFAYAVQWFLFAAVAVVIYGMALMKRARAADLAPPVPRR